MKKLIQPALILSIYLAVMSPLTALAANHGHGGKGGADTTGSGSSVSSGTQGSTSSNGSGSNKGNNDKDSPRNIGQSNSSDGSHSATGDDSNHGQNGTSEPGKSSGPTPASDQAATSLTQLSAVLNGLASSNNRNTQINLRTQERATRGNRNALIQALQDYTLNLQSLGKSQAAFRKDLSEVKALLAEAQNAGLSAVVQSGTQDLQPIIQTLQQALRLSLEQTQSSNNGAPEKGTARALSVLKAIEALSASESSALTTATNALTTLISSLESELQQSGVTGSVYGSVYGTTGSSDDVSVISPNRGESD